MPNKKQKILLFGGTGQIGSVAIPILSSDFEIISPSHSELNLEDKDKLKKFIEKVKPSQILHTAGYTNTDGAGTEIDKSFLANCASLMDLSFIASQNKIPLHYLSTELVFDGKKTNKPYTEEDTPNPLLINGKTKRLGELVVLSSNPKNSVLRLIMCYSSNYPRKLDIARAALSKLKKGEEFTATYDQLVNPIYVEHLINAVKIILQNQASGTYHLGATTYTTPYEFIKTIAQKLNLDIKLVKKTSFKKFAKTRPQPRPKDQWLDIKKFEKDFGKGILKSVDEGINDFIKNLPT